MKTRRLQSVGHRRPQSVARSRPQSVGRSRPQSVGHSRPRSRFCAVLALSLVAVGPALAKEIDKEFHESFEVREGAVLRLHHGDGDVSIQPWDKEAVDVHVRYRVEVSKVGWGDEPDFDVEFRQSQDEIQVMGRETGKGGISVRSRREYSYTVRAPDYVQLKLVGDDGDVTIASWRGDIECKLDDGDLTLKNIRSATTRIETEDGDLDIDGLEGRLLVSSDDGNVSLTACKIEQSRLQLEDGDLRIEDCEGELEIRGDDGDVTLRGFRGGLVDIRTQDGDVELDIRRGRDLRLKVTTDDGSVDLDLEEGVSAAFSVDSRDGRIRVDLPQVSGFEKSEGRASGEVAGGDGEIFIRTQDGNVTIREGR